MQCISPMRAGWIEKSGSLTFKKNAYADKAIELPCRKCLPCRLNQAREKSIRCWHESQMVDDSIFLTLTYDDDHIGDNKLDYLDFQKFIRDLRYHTSTKFPKMQRGLDEKTKQQIKEYRRMVRDKEYKNYMVTGEYGDKTKRKHWHAILFNYRPRS